MLQRVNLFFGDLAASKFGILGFLQVSKELLLCLSALEGTILLWVHGQLEEFFVVLSIVPTVLVHFLLEVVECVLQECMWICIGKLAFLFLGELHKFWCNLSWNASALAEDHTPHGIVHHHEASFALLNGKQVHQRDVLGIL